MHPPNENADLRGAGALKTAKLSDETIETRAKIKREIFNALRHWLAHGRSDFEARRIRAEGDAERKGGGL